MTIEQRFTKTISGLTRIVDFERFPGIVFLFKKSNCLFVCNFLQKDILFWYSIKEVLTFFNPEFIEKQIEQFFKNPVRILGLSRDTSQAIKENFPANKIHQLQKNIPMSKTGTLYELMPTAIKKNENGQIHCIDGPALCFNYPDENEGHHFYRGVFLTPEIFASLQDKSITFETWANQTNEEVKSAILAYIEEVHGSEALYRFVSNVLSEVDTYVDKKDPKYLEHTTGGMNIGVYTLFKGSVDASIAEGNQKKKVNLAYVRCYCPSTDRMFFLGVKDTFDNVKDAIGSLYKCPRKMIPYISGINRQGERFSTFFTEEGKAFLKTLSQEDIADLVGLPGDQYFSLLRYEY